MKSKFLFNIILLVFLNLIVKPIYIFGVEIKVQNVLGESAYGSYFEILSLVFIFSIVNDLGINVLNTIQISKNLSLAQRDFKRLLTLKLVLSFVFLCIVLIFFQLLKYDIETLTLLILISVVFILSSYFMFLRSNLSGLGMYTYDSIISVADKLILIVIMIFLLYTNYVDSFRIEYFLYAQIGSLIMAIILARIFLWKYIQDFNFEFSKEFNKGFLKKSLPFAIVFLLMTIYSRMDGVMLGRLLDDKGKEAGIYAAGYRLFDAGAMFAYLFSVLLLPMYSRLIDNKKELQSLSEMAYKLIWVYAILLALSFLFYGNEISRILYTQGNEYYGLVLSILMFGLIGIAVSYIYGTMIVAKGEMYKLNWLFIFCIVLNFLLNIILIPTHKAYGAAIATFITQLVSMIGQIIVCHQTIGIKINFKLYRNSIIFGMICGTIFYGINHIVEDWMISMIINIILSTIIAFFMKMIDISFLTNMIRGKTTEQTN